MIYLNFKENCGFLNSTFGLEKLILPSENFE